MKFVYFLLFLIFSTSVNASALPIQFNRANRPKHKLRLTKKIKRPKPPKTFTIFKGTKKRKPRLHARYY